MHFGVKILGEKANISAIVFACFAQPLVQNGGSSLLILLALCDKGERKEYERAIFFLNSGPRVRDFGLGGGGMVTSPLGVLWQIGPKLHARGREFFAGVAGYALLVVATEDEGMNGARMVISELALWWLVDGDAGFCPYPPMPHRTRHGWGTPSGGWDGKTKTLGVPPAVIQYLRLARNWLRFGSAASPLVEANFPLDYGFQNAMSIPPMRMNVPPT
uniref:Uncharacterized protein n=1 Tax=mine drainage metagenome TaxID=410659 RepID=E6Q0G5_9ZZZZ